MAETKSVVIFSVWSPDYPAPIAHRLDKMIRSLNNKGLRVILVSYYMAKPGSKKNTFRHYSIEKWLPFLGKISGSRSNNTSESAQKNVENSVSFFQHLKWFLLAVFRCIAAPDINIILAIPASFLLVFAIVKYKSAYVISLTNPASFAFVGSRVGWMMRRNVISDIGDVWYEIKQPKLHYNFERKFHQWFEKTTVQRSQLVTFAYPELRDLFADKYPAEAYKMHALEQGYDGEFVSPEQQNNNSGNVFTIGYFGTLKMSPQYSAFLSFLEVLTTLFRQKPPIKSRIKILVAGNIDSVFQQKITSADFAETIDFIGYLASGELETTMQKCDAFLVISGKEDIPFSYLVPQKLYMYMPYKKPLIYIGNKGRQIERLKKVFSLIYAFAPGEAAAMEKLLMNMINKEIIYANIDDSVLTSLDFRNQFNKVFNDYFK